MSPRHRRIGRAARAAALACTMAVAASATGQVEQGLFNANLLPSSEELAKIELTPALLAMVAGLDAQSYQQREQATRELRDAAYPNDHLYAVLDRRELSAEQRHRIIHVIAERLLTRPRGAVGIRIANRRLPAIVVDALIPDLPAARKLEVGDRITHLEGKPIASWDMFRRAVQEQLPGTRIKVRIERGGELPAELAADEEPQGIEVLDIELELGSAELLQSDPSTGRAPDSDVMRDRQEKVRLTAERFGGACRKIEIDGDAETVAEKPMPKTKFEINPDLGGEPGR